jgi:hypothetical protein
VERVFSQLLHIIDTIGSRAMQDGLECRADKQEVLSIDPGILVDNGPAITDRETVG